MTGRVSAPASSANLGPGFDALAVALELPFELAAVDPPPEGFRPAEDGHPAAVAHRRAGGSGPLWWRSPIPPGRGLGFSGAARVAGAYLARSQAGEAHTPARTAAFEVAAELEGHADNAAASAFGGVVAVAGGRPATVPLGLDAVVVAWSPDEETSTRRSRASLPDEVPFAAAVDNVARVAVLVAALASGDPDALGAAGVDHLHQERRLADAPDGRRVLAAMTGAGAWHAWLSGSGPTIAAFTAPEGVAAVTAAIGAAVAGGTIRALSVAVDGVGPARVG